MKIDIPFEIGDQVWFIHPYTMKAMQEKLRGLTYKTSSIETKIKYNLENYYNPNDQEFYVYNIFKTKEDLINSL